MSTRILILILTRPQNDGAARRFQSGRPVVSAVSRQKRLIFVAVLVAVVAAAGCGRMQDPEPGQARVAVMSFNVVHAVPPEELPWSVKLPAMERMLSDKEPDIIGFQETLAHQVEDLAEALHAYEWVGGGREDGNRSGELDPIFFRTDRFELKRHGIFWLSESPDLPSIGWDATTHRIVTWAELVPLDGGRSVTVFNTHFDHLGGTARAQSALLLVQQIDQYSPSGSVIVTGDLNAVALDPPLEPLFDELDDARTSAPVSDLIGSLNSWRTKYGLYNIDFILVRGATPARFETVNDGYGVDFLSDHFPIVATLYINE